MNNQYRYSGQPLTPRIAQELIQELFTGQAVQKQEIAKAVDKAHLERGGLVSEDPFTTILAAMKKSGLAENLEMDVWSICSDTTERTGVKTLNEFLEWALQFNSGADSKRYLFRGVSSADYRIDASAYRRIKKRRDSDEEEDGDFEKFLQINKDLIREARLRGHDRKNEVRLEDLELLAEFQHYGAATLLMDFTYNALVALWFACKKSSGDAPKDGKVVAVPSYDPKSMVGTRELSIITLGSLEKKIDDFSLDNKKIYQWQPRHQNNRIIAQQSIFLFGVLEIEVNPREECIIDRDSKADIRESLRRIYGITADMLFPDFDGFARQYSQRVPYTQPTADQYKRRAYRAVQNEEYLEAISDYTVVIEQLDERNDVEAYYWRGIANNGLGIAENKDPEQDDAARNYYEDAIEDFSEAIRLNPSDPYPYYNRGIARSKLERNDDAKQDFKDALQRAQESGNKDLKAMIKRSLDEINSHSGDSNE